MLELNKKARIICVLQFLEEFTDAEHPLDASAIREKLLEYGISSERKAIYDDIEILRELGYDIERAGGKNGGYYLASRRFSMPEVCLLVDAVQSAGFIPRGHTKNLVERLEGLVSRHQAEELKSRVCIENRSKASNDSVYRIIEQLSDAMTSKKAVKIIYTKNTFDGTKVIKMRKELTVSPYALLWESDHYYLIGNNPKYENLMHLKVDRIESVEPSTHRWRHFSEVSDYKQRFDIADYANKTFNMFGGEKCRIDLECSEELLDQILDRFGNGIFIRREKERKVFRFSADAYISEGLIGWLMQFGGKLRVLSPKALVSDVAKRVEELRYVYYEE